MNACMSYDIEIETIIDLIVTRRKAMKISRAAVARALKISDRYMAEVEDGSRFLTPVHAAILERILGYPAGTISFQQLSCNS